MHMCLKRNLILELFFLYGLFIKETSMSALYKFHITILSRQTTCTHIFLGQLISLKFGFSALCYCPIRGSGRKSLLMFPARSQAPNAPLSLSTPVQSWLKPWQAQLIKECLSHLTPLCLSAVRPASVFQLPTGYGPHSYSKARCLAFCQSEVGRPLSLKSTVWSPGDVRETPEKALMCQNTLFNQKIPLPSFSVLDLTQPRINFWLNMNAGTFTQYWTFRISDPSCSALTDLRFCSNECSIKLFVQCGCCSPGAQLDRLSQLWYYSSTVLHWLGVIAQ